MTREERLASLSEKFRRHQDARAMTQSAVWAELWTDLEQELLERLLACGPTDNEARWRMQTAIEVARRVRHMFEVKGITPDHLEKEMAILAGERVARVA